MARPIYVDLDATLIDSSYRGDVARIYPRPGIGEFLGKLSKHGDLFLLTHAMRPHVKSAFREIGRPARLFQGVISREDMEPVIEQVEYLFQNSALTQDERAMLYQEIAPLAPRGFVFDDQAVGSELYAIKAATVGARPTDWIQVKPFRRSPDDRELERAYREYRRRMEGTHAILSGRAFQVTG
jgi:hypothetical protein